MRRLHLRKKTIVQLAVFSVVSLTAAMILGLGYARLPYLWFNAGHYDVTVELPEAAGLYARGNVTYMGIEVGEVKGVQLTGDGVAALLSLSSRVHIPSDVFAEVHSQTAVGEQYVELLPRNDASPALKAGDVISRNHTDVPPDINSLLTAANRGLEAIPGGNLKTVIDESSTALSGLGPDLSRLVRGTTAVAIGARKNLGDLINVVDNTPPLLDTQTDTADSVRAWASHLATITNELRTTDSDVRGVLRNGPGAADEARRLFDRLQPTLPILLANLASAAPVLVTYQPDVEELIVLLPMAVQLLQAIALPDKDNDAPTKGINLNFNLQINLPPPCTTGFLPPQQMRATSLVDYPDRPAGDLYCRIPQDSQLNVRGARNIPCETRPGKRAPTVKLCESDENYVPLNDGLSWKGDPNATLSRGDIPQVLPGATRTPLTPSASPPPVAVAQYDPASGNYIGPDGQIYNQANLNQLAPKDKSWQDMLMPKSTR